MDSENERFERVLDGLADAVLVVGPDNIVRYGNATCKKLFGRPLEELIDKPFPVPVTAGESVDVQIVSGDAGLIDVEIRGTDISYKGENCVLVALRDISERNRQAQALRESEQRFRQAFLAAGNGMLLFSPDMRILDANDRACDLLGAARESLLGTDYLALLDPDERDEHRVLLLRLLAGDDDTLQIEQNIVTKSGETRPAMLGIGVVRDDNDDPVHFVEQIADLSVIKETEAKYLQAQKMEVVGNLTGGIAHDFNNILGIIIGNLQLLQMRITDDSRSSKYAQSSIAAAQRAADLTQQLLAFSRKQDLQASTININDKVRDVVTMLRRTVSTDIEISTDLSDDIGLVRVDPAQFEAAVLNLCINARDAMPDGGRLDIATDKAILDAAVSDTDDLTSSGQFVRVTVSDTGSGIGKEVLDEIFQPFFTTKDPDKGTGLGLSMVHGFVNQSGGHIEVESEPGRGTRFQLYFPKTINDHAADVAAAESNILDGHGETILLVEDNPELREITVDQLEELGYRVITATHASDALAKLVGKPGPDLILTDVVMPGDMNGQQLAETVQAQCPETAVLLASGYPRENLVNRGVSYPLLHKPFTYEELSVAIRRALVNP